MLVRFPLGSSLYLVARRATLSGRHTSTPPARSKRASKVKFDLSNFVTDDIRSDDLFTNSRYRSI